MPTRGYRKGISDKKKPSPKRVYTRLPDDVHAAANAEADVRHMTTSRLMREIVTAHCRQTRAELPQPRVNKHTHRVLAGVANNLNQLTRLARLRGLHLLEHDAKRVLDRILSAIDKLPL